ncbi:MAG: cyclic nucleotide-binding domain-containing protein [Ignavibacteriales bacterium]|nr:cyclic nucleotide-binding domain-containing protein [Ignavibacteriales bacterium]
MLRSCDRRSSGSLIPPGMTVVEQGEPADYLYLIEHGLLEILYTPYDGEPITITHVEVGGLFGWSAVVGSPRYTSSGVCHRGPGCYPCPGDDLRQLCSENPEAGRVILDRLAEAVSKGVGRMRMNRSKPFSRTG